MKQNLISYMNDIKEIEKKEFTRSGATKHYLKSLREGFKFFLVTNFRGFGRSFMVVDPKYFSELLHGACQETLNDRLEREEKATKLDERLSEIEGEIRENSRERSNKRWSRDE